jgi:hypothetical protein
VTRVPRGSQAFTTIELVASLTLGSLVALAAMGAFFVHHRSLSVTVAQGEVEAAIDLVGRVLSSELRAGIEGRDWQILPGDSVRLRAFRATAKVCDSSGAVLWVEASGDRSVDPAKDSLLVLADDGVWYTRAPLTVTTSVRRCAGLSASASERWTLDAPVPGAVVARVFERGTYVLPGGALRYRRGGSGRQPLTPAVFDSTVSVATALANGGIGIAVTSAPLHSGVRPRAWSFRLRPRGTAP